MEYQHVWYWSVQDYSSIVVDVYDCMNQFFDSYVIALLLCDESEYQTVYDHYFYSNEVVW